MDKLLVEGGVPLKGKVRISGAKNAVLPILAATLLTGDTSVIEGVPRLKDVETMIAILRHLLVIVSRCPDRDELPYDARM